MKVMLIGLAIVIVGALGIELGLRLFFGFGKPPLYQADDAIGYLLAPNQRLRRFGNRIEINQYSMRTGPIQKQRPDQQLRIFLLGDSIVNGNWWTDQQQTLSALIESTLQSDLKRNPSDPTAFSNTTEVKVLNASANSWGPRNEFAYLQKFGSFESQILVLVLNTDDLFGTQPTPLQVGRERNYPNQNPAFAIAELFNYAFKKYPPIPELQAIRKEKGDRVGINIEAVSQINQFIKDHHGQLILAMTPLKREVLPPGPKDYEIKARQRVHEFVTQENIPYIDFLAPFQTTEDKEGLYRDHIHLSPAGNQQVCHAISQTIQNVLRPNEAPGVAQGQRLRR